MKYFWTFFWTFALIQMLTYVAGAMMGTEFNFTTGAVMAVIATIIILIAPAILPNEPSGNESH
ncbi:YjzD family protein [Robertmurraya sp. Marseille-Q9965]